jgi:hypothetical protein
MRCAREACGRWTPGFLVQRQGRGLVLDGSWFCSRPCLEAEAHDRLEDAPAPEGSFPRGQNVSRLGSLLLHRHLVSQASLDEALARQRTSGRRLGAELCAMGALTSIDLLRTLATQSRSGYLKAVDPARVQPGVGGLSRDVVTTLGIVPIEADATRGRLVVACAAPLPRLPLAILRALVHYAAVEPLLVDDAVAAALLEAYGTAPERTRVTRVGSMRDAVERIASGVESGRVQRVQSVRCDSWLWVRLEGGEVPEEIVLPSRLARGLERLAQATPDLTRKDATSWPVAPTAH